VNCLSFSQSSFYPFPPLQVYAIDRQDEGLDKRIMDKKRTPAAETIASSSSATAAAAPSSSSSSSSVSSSISSSHVRQEEIDRLKSRVDSVLRNLVQGTEADTLLLNNQLHSLRGTSPNTTTTTTTPTTLLASLNGGGTVGTSGSDELMIGSTANSTAGTVLIGNTTNSKFFNLTLADNNSNNKQWIVDPYGDQGEYTGEMNSSKLPHGIGIMKYSDGRIYQGGWKNGQWHGDGRASFSNGDMFMGLYHEDQRHGEGWYKWSDGREYKGGFVNDQRAGHGIYVWPDGARYIGEFQNGLRNGEGTYTVSINTIQSLYDY
jgi:hypothetical protein